MTRRRATLLGAAVAILAALALTLLLTDRDASPTAVVVDAETGAPVAGAVYLAVWWKNSVNEEKPWWEGGATVMERFVEGRTGPDGVIDVPGFWRRRIALNPNTLTVYKPGYVLWFQEKLFPTYADRTDFNRENRIVKLNKWQETMSYVALSNFSITATKGNLSRPVYMGGKRLLKYALQRFEADKMQQEREGK